MTKKRTYSTKYQALKKRKKGDRIYYDPFKKHWYSINFDKRNIFTKILDKIKGE